MKGNDAGTSGSEIRHNAIDGFHHQMYVDRGGNAVVTQGFQHHWPNRQIGNIVVIHDVKMHDICTRCQGFCGIFTQAGKISRQN